MGIAASGKTTVGKLLSSKTGIPFFDADDFHSISNKQKMAAGQPLDDEDRKDWLLILQQLIATETKNKGCILACSALKESYRQILNGNNDGNIKFVFLQGDFALLSERLKNRKGHFFSPSLLQSQLNTLEIPSYALTLTINQPVETIVKKIQKEFFAKS